jgi:hypothetical protein
MVQLLVGVASFLFILMVAPELVLIVVLIALVLAVLGGIAFALFMWGEAIGLFLVVYLSFMALWFAWDAFQARFPHSTTYYLGVLYGRLFK